MDDKLLPILLGPDAAGFVSLLRRLCTNLPQIRYTYMPNDEYASVLRCDISRGMQIYVTELIYRAHSAALTILCKVLRWVEGVLGGADSDNLLVFAASLRGLLECTADANDATRALPLTLARYHSDIIKATRGEAKSLMVWSKLEDMLIHYSHATNKPDKEAPPSHKAKKTRDYLDGLLAMKIPLVHDCYRELSDLTHPGALAFAFFFDSKDPRHFIFSNNRDPVLIAYFCKKYRSIFLPLLECACNPAFVTLRIINAFGIRSLIVPELNHWNFENVVMWQKVKKAMPHVDTRADA